MVSFEILPGPGISRVRAGMLEAACTSIIVYFSKAVLCCIKFSTSFSSFQVFLFPEGSRTAWLMAQSRGSPSVLTVILWGLLLYNYTNLSCEYLKFSPRPVENHGYDYTQVCSSLQPGKLLAKLCGACPAAAYMYWSSIYLCVESTSNFTVVNTQQGSTVWNSIAY